MKTIRRQFCVFMIVLALFAPVRAGSVSGDTTVYITKTGECYHQAFCWHLRQSRIAVTLREADADGYRPCKNCCPLQIARARLPGEAEKKTALESFLEANRAA